MFDTDNVKLLQDLFDKFSLKCADKESLTRLAEIYNFELKIPPRIDAWAIWKKLCSE